MVDDSVVRCVGHEGMELFIGVEFVPLGVAAVYQRPDVLLGDLLDGFVAEGRGDLVFDDRCGVFSGSLAHGSGVIPVGHEIGQAVLSGLPWTLDGGSGCDACHGFVKACYGILFCLAATLCLLACAVGCYNPTLRDPVSFTVPHLYICGAKSSCHMADYSIFCTVVQVVYVPLSSSLTVLRNGVISTIPGGFVPLLWA